MARSFLPVPSRRARWSVKGSRYGRGQRLRPATLLAAVAVVTGVWPAVAGSSEFGPNQVIRTAPSGTDLAARDMAGRDDDLAVAWEEQRGSITRTFLRWSTDGGRSFEPSRRPLAGASANARGIAVDICGPFVFAAQAEQEPEGKGLSRPVLHRYPLTGPGHAEYFANGFAWQAIDVACSDRFVAVAFITDFPHSETQHVTVWMKSVVAGAFPDRMFSLGTANPDDGLTVAATRRDIYVSWVRDDRVRFKRFAVATDTTATVTLHPSVTLFDISAVGVGGRPRLAARDPVVVLAYQDRSDVRVRTSSNRGRSFGLADIVVNVRDPELEWAYPTTVDIDNGGKLVETVHVRLGCASAVIAGCGPEGFVEQGTGTGLRISDCGGCRWEETSRHANGTQVGTFFGGTEGGLAEAWDKAFKVPPLAEQKLLFHATP